MLNALAIAIMLCALSPAALFCINLRRYRPPSAVGILELPLISVLIPARDEEWAIAKALAGALSNTGVAFEVVVMDDCSTDATATVVQSIAEKDARVRLARAPLLPPRWNGKQHTCWELALVAEGELLCFVDADVRLSPLALAQTAAFLVREDVALVSGFPREITKTWMEWLLLPLIHFVLLGFLPIGRMRKGADPAFAAGCGQFIMVRRDAYFAAGGHAAIRHTMHDGLLLPRLLRQRGYRTDLADLTELATCRMYRNAHQVWQGLAKNATEGLAAPVRILPISVILILGQVMPFALLGWLWLRHGGSAPVIICLFGAILGAWLPRVLAVFWFRQDWRSSLLHPIGILVLLVLQWHALVKRVFGGTVSWKNRSYAEK
jgi:hypothetical protein